MEGLLPTGTVDLVAASDQTFRIVNTSEVDLAREIVVLNEDLGTDAQVVVTVPAPNKRPEWTAGELRLRTRDALSFPGVVSLYEYVQDEDTDAQHLTWTVSGSDALRVDDHGRLTIVGPITETVRCVLTVVDSEGATADTECIVEPNAPPQATITTTRDHLWTSDLGPDVELARVLVKDDRSLASRAGGNMVAVATVVETGAPVPMIPSQPDILEDGSMLWTMRFDTTSLPVPCSVRVDISGDVRDAEGAPVVDARRTWTVPVTLPPQPPTILAPPTITLRYSEYSEHSEHSEHLPVRITDPNGDVVSVTLSAAPAIPQLDTFLRWDASAATIAVSWQDVARLGLVPAATPHEFQLTIRASDGNLESMVTTRIVLDLDAVIDGPQVLNLVQNIENAAAPSVDVATPLCSVFRVRVPCPVPMLFEIVEGDVTIVDADRGADRGVLRVLDVAGVVRDGPTAFAVRVGGPRGRVVRGTIDLLARPTWATVVAATALVTEDGRALQMTAPLDIQPRLAKPWVVGAEDATINEDGRIRAVVPVPAAPATEGVANIRVTVVHPRASTNIVSGTVRVVGALRPAQPRGRAVVLRGADLPWSLDVATLFESHHDPVASLQAVGAPDLPVSIVDGGSTLVIPRPLPSAFDDTARTISIALTTTYGQTSIARLEVTLANTTTNVLTWTRLREAVTFEDADGTVVAEDLRVDDPEGNVWMLEQASPSDPAVPLVLQPAMRRVVWNGSGVQAPREGRLLRVNVLAREYLSYPDRPSGHTTSWECTVRHTFQPRPPVVRWTQVPPERVGFVGVSAVTISASATAPDGDTVSWERATCTLGQSTWNLGEGWTLPMRELWQAAATMDALTATCRVTVIAKGANPKSSVLEAEIVLAKDAVLPTASPAHAVTLSEHDDPVRVPVLRDASAAPGIEWATDGKELVRHKALGVGSHTVNVGVVARVGSAGLIVASWTVPVVVTVEEVAAARALPAAWGGHVGLARTLPHSLLDGLLLFRRVDEATVRNMTVGQGSTMLVPSSLVRRFEDGRRAAVVCRDGVFYVAEERMAVGNGLVIDQTVQPAVAHLDPNLVSTTPLTSQPAVVLVHAWVEVGKHPHVVTGPAAPLVLTATTQPPRGVEHATITARAEDVAQQVPIRTALTSLFHIGDDIAHVTSDDLVLVRGDADRGALSFQMPMTAPGLDLAAAESTVRVRVTATTVFGDKATADVTILVTNAQSTWTPETVRLTTYGPRRVVARATDSAGLCTVVVDAAKATFTAPSSDPTKSRLTLTASGDELIVTQGEWFHGTGDAVVHAVDPMGARTALVVSWDVARINAPPRPPSHLVRHTIKFSAQTEPKIDVRAMDDDVRPITYRILSVGNVGGVLWTAEDVRGGLLRWPRPTDIQAWRALRGVQDRSPRSTDAVDVVIEARDADGAATTYAVPIVFDLDGILVPGSGGREAIVVAARSGDSVLVCEDLLDALRRHSKHKVQVVDDDLVELSVDSPWRVTDSGGLEVTSVVPSMLEHTHGVVVTIRVGSASATMALDVTLRQRPALTIDDLGPVRAATTMSWTVPLEAHSRRYAAPTQVELVPATIAGSLSWKWDAEHDVLTVGALAWHERPTSVSVRMVVEETPLVFSWTPQTKVPSTPASSTWAMRMGADGGMARPATFSVVFGDGDPVVGLDIAKPAWNGLPVTSSGTELSMAALPARARGVDVHALGTVTGRTVFGDKTGPIAVHVRVLAPLAATRAVPEVCLDYVTTASPWSMDLNPLLLNKRDGVSWRKATSTEDSAHVEVTPEGRLVVPSVRSWIDARCTTMDAKHTTVAVVATEPSGESTTDPVVIPVCLTPSVQVAVRHPGTVIPFHLAPPPSLDLVSLTDIVRPAAFPSSLALHLQGVDPLAWEWTPQGWTGDAMPRDGDQAVVVLVAAGVRVRSSTHVMARVLERAELTLGAEVRARATVLTLGPRVRLARMATLGQADSRSALWGEVGSKWQRFVEVTDHEQGWRIEEDSGHLRFAKAAAAGRSETVEADLFVFARPENPDALAPSLVRKVRVVAQLRPPRPLAATALTLSAAPVNEVLVPLTAWFDTFEDRDEVEQVEALAVGDGAVVTVAADEGGVLVRGSSLFSHQTRVVRVVLTTVFGQVVSAERTLVFPRLLVVPEPTDVSTVVDLREGDTVTAPGIPLAAPGHTITWSLAAGPDHGLLVVDPSTAAISVNSGFAYAEPFRGQTVRVSVRGHVRNEDAQGTTTVTFPVRLSPTSTRPAQVRMYALPVPAVEQSTPESPLGGSSMIVHVLGLLDEPDVLGAFEPRLDSIVAYGKAASMAVELTISRAMLAQAGASLRAEDIARLGANGADTNLRTVGPSIILTCAMSREDIAAWTVSDVNGRSTMNVPLVHLAPEKASEPSVLTRTLPEAVTRVRITTEADDGTVRTWQAERAEGAPPLVDPAVPPTEAQRALFRMRREDRADGSRTVTVTPEEDASLLGFFMFVDRGAFPEVGAPAAPTAPSTTRSGTRYQRRRR